MATTTVLAVDGVDGASMAAATRIVARHEGDVMTTQGGLTARFISATSAVRAAIALQQAAEGAAWRAGVHVGDDPAGVGGTTVAARQLCEEAAPGEIVVSEITRLLVTDGGFDIEPRRDGSHAVRWDPTADAPPLRVVLAEDASIIRAGLVRLLTDEGFDVVADVADHDSLLDAARRERPDLVITDIRMPPTHTDEGLRAAAVLRAEQPDVGILVLSQHVEPSAAVTLLAEGSKGVGYMLKERVSEVDELVAACRSVAAGATIVDPLVAQQLVSRRCEDAGLARLSPREREVLELMAQGRSNHAIASALVCSEKTVESHVRSIFTKLDLPEHADDHRRVAAVVRWLDAAR